MLQSFTVDRRELRHAGSQTQRAAKDMADEEIARARTSHERLLPTWEGSDQLQYTELVDEVLAMGDQLSSDLEAVGLALAAAHSTYRDADRRGSRRSRRIGEALNG